MGYPTAWRRYSRLLEAGITSETMGYASIFAARYRFADAFEGIHAEGIGKQTVRGYETLMRLVLIQTALEALKKVTGDRLSLEDDALVARIRNDPEFVEILLDRTHRHQEYGRKRKQDARIAELVAGDVSDLSSVLQRVRNMFAHGDSTSNRFALDRNRRRRQLLTDIGDLGLARADNTFSEWVDVELSIHSD